MSDDTIQLRDQVGVLRRRWTVVATVVLLAIGIGLALFLLRQPVYVASTEVLLADRADGTPLTAEEIATEAKEVELNADEVIKEEDLTESASDLLETVTVSPDETGAAVLVITAARPNGEEAADIANGLANAYLDADTNSRAQVADLDKEIEKLDLRISELGSELQSTDPGPIRLRLESSRRSLLAQRSLLIDARANIVINEQTQGAAQGFEEAEVPTSPASPNLVRDLGLATVLGLLAGVGAAYLRDHFDDVIRDESGVGQELHDIPVLARIPHWRVKEESPVTLAAPRSQASEAYRELAANARTLLTGRVTSSVGKTEGKVVLVSSSAPFEGKTATALNLAVVAASAGQRVVLVDANLRRPALNKMLGLDANDGLVQVLQGATSVRTAMADTEVHGTPVAAGDRVILLYPSANRDEDVFPDPFTFDVRRAPNPHVAFGFGPHVCLGAPLARLELRILLEELTARFTGLHRLSDPDIEPNIFASAVRSFELGFSRR